MITFFIMIIILSIVLSISALLYSQVKVIRNIGDSMVSFYVADSGIEKVIYYDRQVLPTIANSQNCTSDTDCASFPGYNCDTNIGKCTKPVSRGLCSMISSNYCASNGGGDSSIYCGTTSGIPSSPSAVAGTTDPANGCVPSICDDCIVTFSTILDTGRTYNVVANVLGTNLEIQSTGIFGSAERKVQIDSAPAQ